MGYKFAFYENETIVLKALDIFISIHSHDPVGFRKRIRNGPISQFLEPFKDTGLTIDESIKYVLPHNQYNLYVSDKRLKDCNKY